MHKRKNPQVFTLILEVQFFIHTTAFERKNASYLINNQRFIIVIPLRFERKTHALEGRCSIQLSYGTILNCGAKVRFFVKTANICI